MSNWYEQTLPYQPHSETSKAAAVAMLPKAGGDRERVLSVIKSHGPLTDEQIQDALGMNPSTERPRRIELFKAGLITKDPVKGTTKSNRKADRWRAV